VRESEPARERERESQRAMEAGREREREGKRERAQTRLIEVDCDVREHGLKEHGLNKIEQRIVTFAGLNKIAAEENCRVH